MSPAVSVVVCVRDGAHELPALLASLRRQTLPRDAWELIFVDDGSTDGTREMLRSEPDTRLLATDGHIGLPAARNMGVAASSAPVIAMTDCDTAVDERWLELGVERFRDPEVDVLAGAVRVRLRDRPNLYSVLDAVQHFDQADYVKRGYGVGANLWVRREVFTRVGGFRGDISPYGGDDNEFGQRATSQGAKLVYAPEVKLEHPPRDTLKALVRKRYNLGFALAAHRRRNAGPLGQTPLLFRDLRNLLPDRSPLKEHRLAEYGQRPGRVELLRLRVGGWLLLHLPRVFGDLCGELAQRRPLKRRA